MPRWILPPSPDPQVVAALASALTLPEAVCHLLYARGHRDADAAKQFLRPRLTQLHPPLGLIDMEPAVDRLAHAIANGETILIHGDYDVDGMASTALLVRVIRAMQGKVVPFIPQRLVHGYGLTDAGVAAALAAGARVVVTADCGTTDSVAIAKLTSAGVDVIVTDHHLPGGPVPVCTAVINPKRPESTYPDRDLVGAGVAFKLALALAERVGFPPQRVFAYLDLVALATVADVAALRGENRVLVRYGLRMLAETRNVGLQALIRSAGLEGKVLSAGRVGFVLAPRLNAVGRLKHGLQGVELLTTEDVGEANRLARDFEELNRQRQDLDRATLVQAAERVEAMDLDATYGIVLAGEGWHPGVIGIVASRLVEQFGRPTVLVALSGEEGKGSGRSISAFDLHAGLSECADTLRRFGGHRLAAGVTVDRARVDEFAERFNAVARARLSPEDLVPEIRVDLEVSLSDVTAGLEGLLRHFEPFGMGNPTPAFLARGLQLAAPPRVLAREGLRLRLSAEGEAGELEAVVWGAADRAQELQIGQPVDVVFRVERDEWQGTSRLQAKVADFRV